MSNLSNLTIEQLNARLAALQDAELKVLTGERVAKASYDGGSVEFSLGGSLNEVRAAIRETQVYINLKSGVRGGGGAIVPGFCG